jgi:hypothetical protein
VFEVELYGPVGEDNRHHIIIEDIYANRYIQATASFHLHKLLTSHRSSW